MFSNIKPGSSPTSTNTSTPSDIETHKTTFAAAVTGTESFTSFLRETSFASPFCPSTPIDMPLVPTTQRRLGIVRRLFFFNGTS